MPAPETTVWAARRNLAKAAIRLLAAEHEDETSPSWAQEHEYACEQFAIAARDLTRAVDKLPADAQPVGWNRA